MTRFFRHMERLFRDCPHSSVKKMLDRATVYDLDAVAAYYASDEGSRWRMEDLPVVAPPEDGCDVVLADYEVPAVVFDQVRALQASSWTAYAEEYLSDIGYGLPPACFGGEFRRANKSRESLNERQRTTIATVEAQAAEELAVYHCRIGGQSAENEGTGGCEWIYATRMDGSPSGSALLSLPLEDLHPMDAAERKFFESTWMGALMPFLIGFCLLSCRNVVTETAPSREGAPLLYLRPVLKPLAYSDGGASRPSRLLAQTTQIETGTFVKLGDDAPLGRGLYWAS